MKHLFYFLPFILSIALPCSVKAEQSHSESPTEEQSKPTFGGYVIGKYAYYDDPTLNQTAGFSLRTLRLYVKGSALTDFRYFMQMDMSGAPGVNSGPKVLDAYGEWCKYDALQLRIGQFNRSFTFEPPINPWDVGFGDYSQAVLKLVGGADRNGEHSSVTRDAGAQIQGDILSLGGSRPLLHYQIGVFNGQGINQVDLNEQKDIIGGVWISPLDDLRIGAFAWRGSYSKELDGELITVDRNRWSVGVDYESDWVFRSEYIASEGGKLTSMVDYENCSLLADGWYVTLGAPIADNMKLYGKWDVYRDERSADSQISIYGLALNWWLHKDVMMQFNYGYVDSNNISYVISDSNVERLCSSKRYNQLQLQAHFRF